MTGAAASRAALSAVAVRSDLDKPKDYPRAMKPQGTST